jgi:hypothetical protein
MNPKKLKPALITFVVIFLAILGNLLRNQSLETIRAVDALQLFACGMMFGVVVVLAIQLMRSRSKEQ